MIKVDETDPVGELEPSFPYREVNIRRNVDMKEFYDLETEIGRGKFGTVYRCREKSTGLALAAKFVGIAKRQERRNVEKEVEIMRALQHPRLIQLYDALESSNVMCVVLELIEGGELFERVIDDDFILTEKSCSVFMRQICEGVAFIHSKNILHLDLKPENIMCLTRTGNRIKIIDFGLARQFDPEKKLQVLFGTPEFVAPEVVNFDAIGYGTDMWSVGVICYVLLSGLSPFMGETDVETMANVTIAQYDFDDVAFDDISADAKDFIKSLLLKDKERRLTASECLSHKWLRRKPLVRPADLDTTKDNLKSVVERWHVQPTSPAVVIVIPPDEPALPPVVSNQIFPDNLPVKVEEHVPIKIENVPVKVKDNVPVLLEDNVPVNITDNVPIKVEQPAPIKVEDIVPVVVHDSLPPSSPPVGPVASVPNVDIKKVDKIVQDEKLPKKIPNLKLKSAGSEGIDKQKTTPKTKDNTGDLESPSPSKQLKVDAKPVKSKGLVHNQTLPNIPASPVEEPKKPTDAFKVQGKITKFNQNKTNVKEEENKTSTFSLKPSSSVTNITNPRLQTKAEINISKILTQNVKPKIAGIVLGQTIPTNETPEKKAEKTNDGNLPKQNGPKVITHKIFIEGKSDQPEKTKRNLPSNKGTVQKTLIPPPFTESTLKPTSLPVPSEKSKNTVDNTMLTDKIERRASDFSCFLHDTETSTITSNLADEVKNLSARLLQMSSHHKSLDDDNNNANNTSNLYNDPIRQFLANHGVVTRRPKHRITNLNRDVPIGSPPPPSNFTYLVSHCPPSSSRLPWNKQYSPEIHSAPQSPRASPSRFPDGASKDVVLRLFDKLDDTSTSVSSSSSIDSLVSYFKTANESQKKATPAK